VYTGRHTNPHTGMQNDKVYI